MIECKTVEEARALEGVVHIEAGNPVLAYFSGDELPAHCTTPRVEVADDLETLLRYAKENAR